MKRLLVLFTVLSLAFLIISCSTHPKIKSIESNVEKGATIEEVESYPDAYVGTGVSAKGLDESIAREQAKANALVDISQQIEVEVKSLAETYMRGTTATTSGAEVALSDQDFMRVAKLVTQNYLRGAIPKKYIHRKDTTIRAIVVMPKAEFYEKMRTAIPGQVSREALRVQIQAEEAQKRLDAEIEKREKDLSGQK